MVERRKDTLIRLLPRDNTLYASQNRTVLATGLDGFISPEPERGLFIDETRMLSQYRYRINQVQPVMVTHSNIQLMAKDLFSGWGIRTLSSDHPAYNPFSYHRGSIWPVEQGTFTIGLMRYGLHEKMEQLCRALFEAAALFDYYRLPEVFSGHPRDERHPFPAFYSQSNSPQAWSASAVFNFIQSILGLYPYAPLHLLLLDPHLPDWLPELTIHHLQVGQAFLDIRFYRKKDGASDYEILDRQGTVHIIRQPSPWSLTASFAERFIDMMKSLL